jgi:DNA-binding transcriptional MerR regulator
MGTLLAFSAEQVRKLTGLSMRQLSYWDRIGFFSPRYADENRRRAYSRIYSFRDVVGLRTLSLLRNKHGVPLQELKKVGEWLRERYDAPWSSLKFYVSRRRVYFEDPDTGARIAGRPLGQVAFPFLLAEVEREVESAARELTERKPSDVGHISRNRHVVSNLPVLSGTRIPTSAVWSLHQAGYDTEAIVREYPLLTAEDVKAAIDHERQRQGRKKAV